MDEQNRAGRSTPTGNPTQKIESSPASAASTPMKPPPSSATSGSAAVIPMPIGQQLSAIDAARSEIEAAVKAGHPDKTDSILARSLEQYSALTKIFWASDDENPYWSGTTRGLHVTGNRTAARKLLDAAMYPASKKVILAELYRLRAITSSRNVDEYEAKTAVEAFAEELADFPADAVIAGLRAWPRQHKWFPTLAEIIEAIWQTCEFRKLIKDDLDG
jgi:hypothetical protein